MSAEQELMLPPGVTAMAQNVGGLQAYSNSFKRGRGDRVFGSDDNGIWLGSADFDDAPFSVSMDGEMNLRPAGGEEEGLRLSGSDRTIIVNDGTDDRVLIGRLVGGF